LKDRGRRAAGPVASAVLCDNVEEVRHETIVIGPARVIGGDTVVVCGIATFFARFSQVRLKVLQANFS
jgi:hypothetical protein